VRWDDIGYYIPLGSGCANHTHHAKLVADEIPKRFAKEMEQDDEDSIVDFPDLSNSDDEACTFYDLVKPHFEALCRAFI
jgi:hypothetical protein